MNKTKNMARGPKTKNGDSFSTSVEFVSRKSKYISPRNRWAIEERRWKSLNGPVIITWKEV